MLKDQVILRKLKLQTIFLMRAFLRLFHPLSLSSSVLLNADTKEIFDCSECVYSEWWIIDRHYLQLRTEPPASRSHSLRPIPAIQMSVTPLLPEPCTCAHGQITSISIYYLHRAQANKRDSPVEIVQDWIRHANTIQDPTISLNTRTPSAQNNHISWLLSK